MKSLADKTAKAMAAMDAATTSAETSDAQPRRVVSNPGAMMLIRPQLQEADERVAKAEGLAADAERLAEEYKSRAGRAFLIGLDKLVSVPGRRRKLSAEEYEQLRGNLRLNPMVNAVVVKPHADGRYEIVSGENRVAVYRELGRDAIECVIRDIEGDETVAAFFANLLQPSLPDFEKYLGFKALMAEQGITQSEAAAAAGISKSYVSRIMAFGDLPPEALAELARRPAAVGAKAAERFSMLAKQGRVDRVVEAVALAVSGEMSQDQALSYAAAKQEARKTREAPETFKIKSGRSVFCNVRATGTELRVSFAEEAVRKEVQVEIFKVLEKFGRKPPSE